MKILNWLKSPLIRLRDLIENSLCIINYVKVLNRLRKEINTRKINVVFLVNEISKWKGQTLFDILESDTHFNPIIGLTCADIDWSLNEEDRIKKRQRLRDFFSQRRMNFVEVCDVVSLKVIDLRTFKADIIFYQQPWNLHKKQRPQYLSRYHLTCYFPYYVPNYNSPSIDFRKEFHLYLWKYYVLSNGWIQTIANNIPDYLPSVKLIATGHPMLDYINNPPDIKITNKMVIYAPHWSVYSEFMDNDEKFSTFQHNGKHILEFAQSHPEIKWIFKPHPTLRTSLIRTRLYSEQEIDEYYNEWGKIGEVVQEDDYLKLFWESYALITDCGSFLMEYACTKKPIIRLVSHVCGMSIPKPSKELFDSYYNVNNLDEMNDIFNMVLIDGNDPKHDERVKAATRAGLIETFASENILKDLYASLGLDYGK